MGARGAGKRTSTALRARCKPDELPAAMCTACQPALRALPCGPPVAMHLPCHKTRLPRGQGCPHPCRPAWIPCSARPGGTLRQRAGIAWRQEGTQGRLGEKRSWACGAEGCRHVRRQWCPLAAAPLTAPSVMTARLRGEGDSSGGSHVRTAGSISGDGAGWEALLCRQRTTAWNGTMRQSNGKTHPRVRSA